MATSERREGPTPAGGAYSIAHWFDADGTPCPRELATEVEIIEYDAQDAQVFRTYGEIHRPTLPRIVAEQPGAAVIVMTGGSSRGWRRRGRARL